MKLTCRLCGFLHQKNVRLNIRSLYLSSVQLSGTLGVGTGKPSRLSVDLDAPTEKYLIDNNIKPKDHPGVFHLKRRTAPAKFVNTVQRIMSHENVKSLAELSSSFRNHLWSRSLPIEEGDYKQKVAAIEDKIRMKEDVLRPFLSQEQLEKLDNTRNDKIRVQLKKQIYHWEAINYDRPKALQYLLSRSAGEYAALEQIFNEISNRDKNFQPSTLCDFGSGIGTTIWACQEVWPKKLREVMCAEISREMNEVAEILLREGNMNNDHGFAALNFRQFLSQSAKITYDLVVSAYSLLELPSLNERLKILDILWKKANNYLVIVEQGTPAGFKAVIEARDYILELDKNERSSEQAHVFSPCPHESPCPRFKFGDTTCKFYVKYEKLYPWHRQDTGTEYYSYVVLKKGPRDMNDERWPRLIKDSLIRSRHCICRVCTKDGNLSEILLTKSKHSELLYRVGRKSKCGDLLPVTQIVDVDVSEQYIETSELPDEDDSPKSSNL